MKSRLMSCAAALMLLLVAAPAAAIRMVSETDEEYRKRLDNEASAEASAEQARKDRAERERQRRILLKAPPLPVERNVLLGSWRLETPAERCHCGSDPERVRSRDGLLSELIDAFSSANPDKMLATAVIR